MRISELLFLTGAIFNSKIMASVKTEYGDFKNNQLTISVQGDSSPYKLLINTQIQQMQLPYSKTCDSQNHDTSTQKQLQAGTYSNANQVFKKDIEINKCKQMDLRMLIGTNKKYTDQQKFNVQFTKTSHSSFAGIQPYQADISQKEFNFVWQMKNLGLIDHQIVTVVPNEYVQFGIWDSAALEPNTKILMVRTQNQNSWNVPISKLECGPNQFLSNAPRTVELAPHMAYIYIPDPDWNQFAYKIHQFTRDDAIPVKCSYMKNYCRWETKCSDVKVTSEILKITLGTGDQKFQLKLNNAKVDGSKFDGSDFCYLPVFMSKLASHKSSQTWYVGSQMLNDYVTVYDNRPFDEYKKSYAQVGFGLKSNNIKKPTKPADSPSKTVPKTPKTPSKPTPPQKSDDSWITGIFNSVFGIFGNFTSITSIFSQYLDQIQGLFASVKKLLPF